MSVTNIKDEVKFTPVPCVHLCDNCISQCKKVCYLHYFLQFDNPQTKYCIISLTVPSNYVITWRHQFQDCWQSSRSVIWIKPLVRCYCIYNASINKYWLNIGNQLFKAFKYIRGTKQNKHNAELQRTDPGTKLTSEFSTKSRMFPPNASNGFLSFPSF